MFPFSASYKKLLLMGFLAVTISLITKPVEGQESTLNWISFEEAVQTAKEVKKPIMVDVWAPWCGWCKKMREEVYPELSEKIDENFVLTRINRDDNNSKIQYQGYTYSPLRLAQKLKVDTVPAIIFLNENGDYIAHITGYRDTDKLDEIFDIVLK